MSLRVFILAGEPSGDRLGAALMEGLKTLAPDVSFEGIGGTLMAEQGLQSRFPMDELSVMGLAEVLPKYRHLKRRIRETADAVIAMRPDVLITIDSPDFSLRVARLVKQGSDIRTVHYVAPSVWAWRPGRAQKMATCIDHVLALLPFEPPYMEAAGMDCDFVGHPVVAEPKATAEEIAALRQTCDLGDAPILLALPGSRRSEVGRLAPVFGAALRDFTAAYPEYRIVVPTAGPVAELVRQHAKDWPQGTVLLDPTGLDPAVAEARKRAAFAAADLALAASGTVSLELAAARTPMVIAYRFQWLTWQIMKRMALIDTVTLVNLVSETRDVPECLGPDCTPSRIAGALADVRANPEAQQDAMGLTMERLGEGGEAPGLRAARAVLARL
ncbi:lipid-A-disaccharide synthase [Phaeobacter gallaeciensis]|uniref:lipid-A-disaccharide synthase n=1 Tax=Phaeobacter gallaeciensis TaxID=60890 RepID=UPI00237F25CD|nr:lipid-A-disaccharide synthase [Phaeobacter gallaeciensis]MDE4096307.1 lipid-A-disaccharide synthase [Phaeobacter gallaeciensis]MDE4105118.1 lipid-A-disaccharide synthase [Phaeobacter gallaeciensis]MDE4109574.1 lipid-A-disaccharide synthase [Phaeobacter gallaeciensis]MDE4114042.1 lipid-A-disaccharide synthase [Phaeobacter gallaeciensis]MDE4118509.1 lipid-A-disaccharide synthase [Phaeobacter gallaeciensis]